MKPYTSYKDSGIPWIGSIPDHWEMRKMKFCFNERVDKNHPQEVKLSATQTNGVIPQTMYEGQGNRVVNVNTGFGTLKLVKAGDFVIHLRSFQGGIEYAYYQGIISPAYTILEPQNPQYIGFYKFLFKSFPFIQLLKTCVTGIREGQNIDYKVLGNKHIPIPPADEQEAIVRYIDEKTAKIDRYITEQERLLSALDELRQAEIARAVTRGLNPDVPLRNSGIDWIGSIPAHWEIRKMKFSFSQRSDKNHPNETKLSATQSHGVIPQSMYEDKGNHVVDVNRNFEGLKLVKVGDFVIHLRSFQGGLAHAYYQGIISAAYTILTPIEKDYTDYYRYLFLSYPYIQLLKTCVTGIREGQNIDYGVLGNKYIPIPPLDEQRAIVEYLDEKTAKIDRMKADVEKQIGLLKEYKQRIISDAVTGKSDVRNQSY